MSKAMKVFERLLFKVGPFSSLRYPNEPGFLVKRLSEEDRKALSRLKSDELNGNRPETYWIGNIYTQNSKERRLEFDKQLKTIRRGNL
jgi:hypothetical protein